MLFCPKCGKKLELAPIGNKLVYMTDNYSPDEIIYGCINCDSIFKVIENGNDISLNWILKYSTHLMLLILSKEGVSIHTHPIMEKEHNISSDHVIIDKATFIYLLKRLV